MSLANRFKKMGAAAPTEGSGNTYLPEHEPQADPPKPIVTPVERSKVESGPDKRKVRPGDLAAPERKSVADNVDGRTLRSTGRVRPLQITVDDAMNDAFREEAARRKDLRLGKHQFNDLFGLMWDAYKEKHGIS